MVGWAVSPDLSHAWRSPAPSKDPQFPFPGAEEPKVGEEAGGSWGAAAWCQGGHRSGCSPLTRGQPGGGRSPGAWLHPHSIPCSHRSGTSWGTQRRAGRRAPRCRQRWGTGTGARPTPGWLTCGHGASLHVVGNGFARAARGLSPLFKLSSATPPTLSLLPSPCPGPGASGSRQRGDGQAELVSMWQSLLEEPSPREVPQPLPGAEMVRGSPGVPAGAAAQACSPPSPAAPPHQGTWALSEPPLLSARQRTGARHARPWRSSTPWPRRRGCGCGLSTA